jgi:hypothetical protein
MASAAEAQAALAALAGKQIQGRALIVEEHRPKEAGRGGPRKTPRPARPVKKPRKRPPPLGSRLRRPRPNP